MTPRSTALAAHGLTIALAQATLGRRVFPIAKDTKAPLIKWKEGASTHPNVIEQWFRRWPEAAVGWALPEGTLVVDIDDVEAFLAVHASITGPGQTTPRGYHIAFRADPNRTVVQGPIRGGDVKVGGKGYVKLYSADAFTHTLTVSRAEMN